MTTYSELVKSFRAKNSKPKTGWRYESWANPDVERIGMKPGGLVEPGVTHYARKSPTKINEETFKKIDDFIAKSEGTLSKKALGESLGYKTVKKGQTAGQGGLNKVIKAWEESRGKTFEFKPATMVGTEKAKQILGLYDEQLKNLPEPNFSEIARTVYNKDDADTRKIVRSLVERERGLKRIPNPKYEGPLTAIQRMSKSRKSRLTPVTNRELEKIIRGTGGFDLHHMESKRWNVTMGNLAYVDSKLNQKELMKADNLLEKLYKQRDNLSSNDIEGHKIINEKGKNIVKNKNLKGLLNFKVYDPNTKKLSDVGMDLSKAIIPEGQFEELRNIPLKELTKEQKTRVIEIAQKSRDALVKGKPGMLKTLGKRLTGVFGPTGIVGLTTGFGFDPKSATDRMGLEAEAALAPELVKATIGATKGMKNRGAQKVVQQLLNLGLPTQTALKVARVASPLGLLYLGGEGLYKMYKEGHFEKERMMPSLMDKEAYAEAQKEKFDVSKPMFKSGGKVDDDK